MEQLLQLFLKSGYEVHFASAAEKGPHSMNLDEIGIHEQKIALNDPSFDSFISHLKPEIVIFDRFITEEQYGWRVAEHAPNALRILDTEDLHSLREARRACVMQGKSFSKERWMEQETFKRELASMFRCDLNLVISSYEHELLLEIGFPASLLHELPFLPAGSDKLIPGYEERSGFLFMGNGKHQPNVDAIRILAGYWPKIRKELPGAEIRIYGAYFPRHIDDLHDPKHGFFVDGWTEDAMGVMAQTRVQLAPLRFGAGQKGKIIMAMQVGTPTVTTSIGAEGICKKDEFPGTIATDEQSFISAAIELYVSRDNWNECSGKTVGILDKYFNSERHISSLLQSIEGVRKNLVEHRRKNLAGIILSHQSLGASRYLSKFIELKNKNKEASSN